MIARTLLALAAIAVVAGGARSASDTMRAEPGQQSVDSRRLLLGMSFGRLYRLDPLTLERLPGPTGRIGGHTFGWSFSSDRANIVLGSQGIPELRFVDLRRMRIIGGDDLRLARKGIVAATAWPAPRRALAVVQAPGCCIGEATAFVVDPLARHIVRRQALRGSLQAFARFRGGLVLLLGRARSVGHARLAVLDRRGKVRLTRLGVLTGQELVQPGLRPGREHRPGLAIDAAGGRAFVVGAGTAVVEVDLHSLSVRSHALSRPVSLLGRLRDWLEPAARADVPPTGPMRRAQWLGGDRLAVAGWDSYYDRDGRYQTRPAGLRLVELGSGRVRTLDPLADGFSVAAARIVPATRSPGLTAYTFDGKPQFRLRWSRRAFVAYSVGTRAFVTIAGRWPRALVVDLRSGRTLGERTLPRAQLLGPEFEPAWP